MHIQTPQTPLAFLGKQTIFSKQGVFEVVVMVTRHFILYVKNVFMHETF